MERKLSTESVNSRLDTEFKRQWGIIARGAVDLLPEGEFEELVRRSIKKNIPLRVKQGFDPIYGARPLRRAIERYVENPLSTMLLRGDFGPGGEVSVDLGEDGLTFTAKAQAKAKRGSK